MFQQRIVFVKLRYAEAETQSASSRHRLRLRERGCCGTGAQKFPPIHRSNALAYSAREEIVWRIVKEFASQSGNRSKIEVAAVKWRYHRLKTYLSKALLVSVGDNCEWGNDRVTEQEIVTVDPIDEVNF
jgi:hypothetical protein